MGDHRVFISYTREDSETAGQLAECLEEAGWSVWWDSHVRPGERFGESIRRQLDAAACVIVLWSESSVQSEWVEAEAARAKRAGTLVPVLLEPVEDRIPLEFSRLNALDLGGWSGDRQHAGFVALCDEVRRRAQEAAARIDGIEGGERPTTVGPQPRRAAALTPRTRTLLWLDLGGLIALLVLLWLISQRAFRLREGDPGFNRYRDEVELVIAGVGLFSLVLIGIGFALGRAGRRQRLNSLVVLGWILTPLSALVFFYHMFIGNRGSHGALFTLPYGRYYTQFNRAFQSEMLVVLAAIAIGVWLLVRLRRRA